MSYYTIEDTFNALKGLPKGSLVEFGVFCGNTMNRLTDGATVEGNPFDKVYGFDSWNGLPKEAPGLWQNPDWPEGAFSLCETYKLKSQDEAVALVRSKITHPNVELISGFFENSLTEELGKRLENVGSYIHCDVDIYLSAYQCMEWVWKYRVAKEGALIRYDDWCSTPANAGQSLAHEQLQQKYGLKFTRISTNIFQFNQY